MYLRTSASYSQYKQIMNMKSFWAEHNKLNGIFKLVSVDRVKVTLVLDDPFTYT